MSNLNNSTLFKQAHRMTKLTIQPNETYRYKFGQWLIFLKTGITNTLGFTNINQSVCYVPILKHDREYQYKMTLPLTFTRYKSGYSESYHLGKMLVLFIMLSLLTYLIF